MKISALPIRGKTHATSHTPKRLGLLTNWKRKVFAPLAKNGNNL